MGQNTYISDIFRIFLKFRKTLWCRGPHDFSCCDIQRKLSLCFSQSNRFSVTCCGAILSPQITRGFAPRVWVVRFSVQSYDRATCTVILHQFLKMVGRILQVPFLFSSFSATWKRIILKYFNSFVASFRCHSCRS